MLKTTTLPILMRASATRTAGARAALQHASQQCWPAGTARLAVPAVRHFSAAPTPPTDSYTRLLSTAASGKQYTEEELADHQWRQQNHIWTKEELEIRRQSATQLHVPQTFSDQVMHTIMRSMYHSFNFITGYREDDPTPRSIEWRLIVLESVAGVPGFLAAMFRHFHSLRTLKRDHGMLYTLLEEAENERMHLLVCLKMFEAGAITRALVVTAQLSMTPFLMLSYTIKPQSMHRFVGYLEETAVQTYSNIVHHVETPGTQLHAAWADLPAPAIAKNYWQLEPDAKWVDALKNMLADEAHHRDVNHTFASLPEGATNPFIHEHMADFDAATVRRAEKLLKKALLEHESTKVQP